MTATEFKAKCLNVIEQLEPGGIVITKRGRAVAKVLPINAAENVSLIGSMKGKIKVKGDLLTTGMHWHAQSGHTYRRRVAGRRAK